MTDACYEITKKRYLDLTVMTSRSQKSDLNLSLTGSQISSSSKSRPLHRPSSVTDVRQSKGDVQKSQSSTKKRNSLHGVDGLSQRSDASSARKKNSRQHGRSASDDFLELFENSMQPKIKGPSASQKKPGPNAVKVLWQPSPKKFGAGDSARTNSTARSNSTARTNSTTRTENKDFDDFLPSSDRQENFFQPSSVRSSSDSEEDCLSSSLSKIQALKEKHKLQQDKMNDLFLSPRDRVVKDAVPKASNFSGIANNMVVTSKPQQVKASLSNIENSYQNIKHKTPVNEVKKQDVSQQLKKQDTSQQIGRNIAEDFIKTLNNAATKIQRWYREHKARQLRNEATVKAGEAALKRLLQQKKQDHVDHKILDLDFLSEDENEKKSAEDRKKLREEKARQARQQAIQELQKKRELKREEVKRKAEEEITYLQASGKITKKPLRVGKKKSPVSDSPVPSKSKDSNIDHDTNTSVSTLKDEDEDLLESISNINPGESSRESARKERSEAASTKTTLDDLLDTLKKLEADEQLETPKPVTKNAWLEDIDKDSTKSHLTSEKLQKLNSVGDSVSKSGFLTDDKLKSIMTFLDEVQTSDRLSSVDQELAKESHNFELPPMLVPSADELLQLDHAKEAADEVTSTVLSQRMELEEKKRSVSMLQKALNQQRELTVRHAREAEREMNKRLDVQKDEYEEAIKRHLGFIDQLIDDKKSMSEKCEKLVKELKTIDKKYQDKIKSLDDRHGLETQKLKDMHEAAEKLRRERWIEDKTKKIKEMTVKGLEPEIQRLIAKHKSEFKKMKQIHEAELLESDERAAQRYVKMTEELRDQLAKEKEAACARERELSKQRYEKELQNEEDAYQQQRRRLHAEVQEEKERVSQQATRQRTELDRLQRQLEDSHAHALTAMKQEYEKSREEQERRHSGIENQMLNSASKKENTDFVAEPIPEDQGLSLNGDSGQDTGAEKDVVCNNKEEIVIDHVTAASIKVPMEVSNQTIKAVIDTGAEVTVLNDDIFFRLSKTSRLKLKPALKKLVVAEAGKQMGTKGIAAVTLTLGDSKFVWDVYVAAIGDDLLLGCDVLDEMDITVNSRKGIQLNGKWIECEVNRKSDMIARVVLTENVTVPANSEMILFGGSDNTDAIDTRYTMLQPVVEDNRKIIVAQILVDPFEKVIPVRLVNMEDHPVQLKRNYLIGELHPVTNITQFDDIQNSTKPLDNNTKNICKLHNLKMNMNLTDEPVGIPDDWNSTIQNCKAENSLEMDDKCRNEAEIPALPDHLKDLFERSSKNIANEETKQKLADMLLKNSKAFASSKTDVGTCSFIKHRIDTAGAAPKNENHDRFDEKDEETRKGHKEKGHHERLEEKEEKHTFECLRFGNFIERLEKRKTDLKEEDELRDMKEKLKLEKESWEQNFLKKQETWVVQKERELKEQVKKERDKEIEMVIAQLEDDATSTREDIERASEHKTRY
ncbi:AZI1 [Mytilus coruscus]|uniref:AZI1 n=1 Tax=Mytilus coruscus TaxID=42192 RepID=A0A6J8B7U9_MYTCO|nr:AZI1 [Mytilus coruscus]